RVATLFTQSVEPGSGTTSTSRPSALNQPIFMATAKAEPTPVVIVRAQVATRSGVWAAAATGPASASSRTSGTKRIIWCAILPPTERRPHGLPHQPHPLEGTGSPQDRRVVHASVQLQDRQRRDARVRRSLHPLHE